MLDRAGNLLSRTEPIRHQQRRGLVIVVLCIGALTVLAACESLSPLAGEDRQATVLDDLNFEVPKTRPVTRKDDPVESAKTQDGSSLTEPIIVTELGQALSSQSTADEGEAIYSVNFDNADLREAASSILGTTLSMDYLIDPRVSGTITLGTTKPVTRNALLRMLDLALTMNGAALMVDGNVIRVVPEDVARASGMRVGTEPLVGYGVTVLPLQYASAGNVARTMASIYTTPGAVAADERSNSLILTGSAEERQGMIELASTFDLDWMSGKSIGLFPLKNAAPDPVARELEAIFSDAIGDVPPTFIRFLPVTRLSAIMVIASDPRQLSDAQAWIDRLDKGNQSERTLRVYYVKNGKATDLANTLSRVFTGLASAGTRPCRSGRRTGLSAGARRYGQSDNVHTAWRRRRLCSRHRPWKAWARHRWIPMSSARPRTRCRRTPPAAPFAQQTTVSGQPTLRVIADAANNSLIILATPPEHEAIEKALQRLDILPLQVLIEATIAEVTLNDQLKYGVEYYFNSQTARGAARGTGLSIAGIGGTTDQRYRARPQPADRSRQRPRYRDHCAERADGRQGDLLAASRRARQPDGLVESRRPGAGYRAAGGQRRDAGCTGGQQHPIR